MSIAMDTFKKYVLLATYLVLRLFFSLLPWIGYELARRHDVPALWPPLGPFGRLAIGPATISITLLGWILPESFEAEASQRRLSKVCFILMLVAMSFYTILGFDLVKEVKLPGTLGGPPPAPVYLSVGFFRTAQAKTKFPHSTDGELIENVGLEDKGMEWGWTHGSVIAARFSLFFSYFLFLASANVTVGLHVKRLAAPLLANLPPLKTDGADLSASDSSGGPLEQI
jgi:hypothetical protein